MKPASQESKQINGARTEFNLANRITFATTQRALFRRKPESQMLKKVGIEKILGYSREAKLIQWLIFATLIEPGSRLSATRLAKRHATCNILNIPDGFNEDDLYSAMDWLEERQSDIENKLFKFKYGDTAPNFYLYDVTSSYFEGGNNELANFGYNRDKKRQNMDVPCLR